MYTERVPSPNYNDGERVDFSPIPTVCRAELEKHLQLNQHSNIDISLKLRSFLPPGCYNNYEQNAFKCKALLIKRSSHPHAVILTQPKQNLH
jgi:hypothetical protein